MKKEGRIIRGSGSRHIDAFLEEIKTLPSRQNNSRTGRLIFAMDATASRAATWDMACGLQAEMFTRSNGAGVLDVQLVFFRGHRECKASRWMGSASEVVRLMSSVSCLAGRTQVGRILKHTLNEVGKTDVDALVYVGDSMEEPMDYLGELAGELKIHKVPIFLFQEGHNVVTASAFRQLARLSGGAHCALDHNSASQLGELLSAAAVFAAGGKQALVEHSKLAGPMTRNLLSQID